jgi:hypothetical protein
MTLRTIMAHARRGAFDKLTLSQLELAALHAFPSSPLQKSIQSARDKRRAEQAKR